MFPLTIHRPLLVGSGGVTPEREHERWAPFVQLALFDERPYRLRRRWRLARRARRYAAGRLLLAGGVITDDRGRILLLHRSTPSTRQWETPGGKIDGRERPELAARRELREELGVEVSVVSDMGLHDIVSGGTEMSYALFEVRVLHGSPAVMEPDRFDELRYFAWSELPAMRAELSPNARNLLDLHRRGRLKSVPVVGAAEDVRAGGAATAARGGFGTEI